MSADTEKLHQQLSDAIREARMKEREVLEGTRDVIVQLSDAAKALDRLSRFSPKKK